MKSMKDKLIYLNRIVPVIIAVITTLGLIPTLTATPPSRRACVTPVIEQYGIGHSSSGDIPLKWRVFIPTDGGTHPAIIVIHGGGFLGGDFTDTQTDQDLVCAGFCVFDIEYRLAPPGKLRGQGSDLGRYPEQTDDVATAIRAARSPAPGSIAFGRVTGKVGAVGGSSGATHAAYCAAAPTLGGDQFDAAVLLSGAYDFHDPASLIDTRCTTFGSDVRNYVGCSPGPACDGNGGLLDLASPYRRFTASSSPVFIVASNLDPMPPNQFTILVNLVAAIGVPNCEHSLIVQTPGPNGCTGHSFDLWPDVSDQAIAFLNTFLQVPPASANVPSDFNNDRYSDYVLHNSTTGQTVIYYMNNNVRMSSTYGPTLPGGWQVAAVGDFNRDGHPDYLLFNPATGETVIYYMNNNILTVSTYGPTLPGGWSVAGVADFNLDGYPDYLLYNANTGATVIWYMRDNVHTGSTSSPTVPGG